MREKLNQFFSIKNVSKAFIILNLLSIIFGIIYLLCAAHGILYVMVLWDVFGLLMLITIFGNLFLVYLNTLRLNKATKLGNRLNLFCYMYLFIIMFAVIIIGFGNVSITGTYSNELSDNFGSYRNIYGGYFGILVLGFLIAFIDFRNLDNRELWDLTVPPNTRSTIKKIIRILIGLGCVWNLFGGIYLSVIVLAGAPLGVQPDVEDVSMTELRTNSSEMLMRGSVGIVGMFVAQAGIFCAIFFLAITILLLKVKNRKKSPKSYYAVALIGLSITGIMMAPLCLTPYSIISADQNFAEAFGSDWRDDIPSDVENNYFLQTPFSLPGYFLGIPSKNCEIDMDKRFYDGEKSNYSQDEDIDLYYDAYYLKDGGDDLPGENSVLIWIHGGGWRTGNKGNYRIQYNKYFAAQGYVVFDIQYGLNNEKDARGIPENVIGDFTIDDMIRHIGIFCRYLVNNSNKYDVDLDSVFISGGSAGGHLTCATALAIDSGEYTQWFGSNLTIKGYVPYYPGNGLPDALGIDGENRLINPEKLVSKDSPPCLIHHGTNDGLAHPQISQNFKDAYTEEDNEKCAIIWAPLAGHANDIYYSGYYAQVFLYYMERFLYLCVNDKI